MLDMLTGADKIRRGMPDRMPICGRIWRLRPINMKQGERISGLAFDALYLQKEAKKEGIGRRKAKRINRKIRQLGAKQAAHHVLGRRLYMIPFAYAITWRWIYHREEEVSATINTARNLYGKDKDFFIANLENLKLQLALSMRQVGEAVKQMQNRKESAEGMLDEDASPKKAADSKSGVRSRSARTTKR